MKYLARDQYGNQWPLHTDYPRKELLEEFESKHAEKMYIDDKDGNTTHAGYIIAGHWLTVWKIAGLIGE